MDADLIVDESLGISNASVGKAWNATELYPRQGVALGVWSYGQQISVSVQGSDARVIRLDMREGIEDRDSAAQAAISSGYGALGEPSIFHSMPIDPKAVAPASFAGGWFNVTFTVPQALVDQLAERKKAYPIPWTEVDARAAWLVPHRLLMYPFVANPADSMQIEMWIDGESVVPTPAYNSRGRKVSRCFLGFYVDASALEAGTPHTLAMKLPALAPGRFQGVFWQNVETEWGAQ